MIIVYAPEGGTKEAFEVARGKLRASEIQIIERTADARWNDIKEAVSEGDLNAMRTVVWVLKKREQPSLRFAEFDPFEGDLYSRLDEREVRAYAEGFVEKYRADPDTLAEAFDELRESAYDREGAEAVIADVTAPKAPAPAEPQPEAAPAQEATETAPSPTAS
ncbi:hypothetical protein [Streptomyces sp. NBC_00582]|uniref:hypothetical protein n=1 Tax=Streptomyces sp. NBC_00582 TaxID=2975783 RepID=UPI002E8207D8|nr:hypothetical protein [Streptomyces sp. NBC_00582]WUB61543.1 hypothetical protein OG852_14645 [Streptomyces sp. NBC_00582]